MSFSLYPNNRENLVVIKSNKNHGFQGLHLFSYVFLATAVILLTGHAYGAGLCDNSPNKQVCYSIVYNRTNPRDATIAAIYKLIYEAKRARVVAQNQPKSSEIDRCISLFESAISRTKIALTYLDENYYDVTKNYIGDTAKIYRACDDAFQQSGKTNPIDKSTNLLKEMVSVGVYLAGLL